MKKIYFELNQEFIRLCDLLKVNGLADSGAQGKHLVADGMVSVDGEAESRKTAKIRPGQTVECNGTRIVVQAVRAQADKAKTDQPKADKARAAKNAV